MSRASGPTDGTRIHDRQQRRSTRVGLIMGSDSDWPTMQAAAGALAEFEVPVRGGCGVGAPHPAADARLRRRCGPAGISVIIAGAGGAAHLREWSPRPRSAGDQAYRFPLKYLVACPDSLLSIVPECRRGCRHGVHRRRNADPAGVRILATSGRRCSDGWQRSQQTLGRWCWTRTRRCAMAIVNNP